MPTRLHVDHANARLLAEALASIDEIEIDLEAVQTNIVVCHLRTRQTDELYACLKSRGLLISKVGPRTFRVVTHNDVDRAACVRAAEILTAELAVSA
jgi:threonine aldolase